VLLLEEEKKKDSRLIPSFLRPSGSFHCFILPLPIMSSSAAAAACWWETVVAWIMGTPMIDSSSKESVDLRAKGDRIEACLAERPVNLWELRELALSKGGFLSGECEC